MSETYSMVDASAAPAAATAWQERMSTWPGVRAYKERTYELLADAARIVDVGCGPGVDVTALGIRRCVGVEPSSSMVAAAVARGAVVCRADAHDLPFPATMFTGARADRVFQHLANPTAALDELLRVVAPGGRIVIADPDQESLVIEVPGVRRSVLDRLKALRRDIGYRNGRLISRVPGLLDGLGLERITVDAFPLVIEHAADAFGLPTWPDRWRAEGRFTDDELAEWRGAIGEAGDGFLYMVTLLVVAGSKG